MFLENVAPFKKKKGSGRQYIIDREEICQNSRD